MVKNLGNEKIQLLLRCSLSTSRLSLSLPSRPASSRDSRTHPLSLSASLRLACQRSPPPLAHAAPAAAPPRWPQWSSLLHPLKTPTTSRAKIARRASPIERLPRLSRKGTATRVSGSLRAAAATQA